MGWGFGMDGTRPVGYMVIATCDKRGCEAEIDRGLGYRCCDGSSDLSGGCGGFFCGDHLSYVGPRGGCPHRWPKRFYGRVLSDMVPNADGSIVCLGPIGHEGPHAWADAPDEGTPLGLPPDVLLR